VPNERLGQHPSRDGAPDRRPVRLRLLERLARTKRT
jgi:hypothetical protein